MFDNENDHELVHEYHPDEVGDHLVDLIWNDEDDDDDDDDGIDDDADEDDDNGNDDDDGDDDGYFHVYII